MQKIPMAMIDYVMVMIRGFYEMGHNDVVLATEDMQGAYRQIPLPDSQVCISITAVYNPSTRQADMFEIFGQSLSELGTLCQISAESQSSLLVSARALSTPCWTTSSTTSSW